MNAIYGWMGWFFCEIAFKTWGLEKEPDSDEEFKARCLSDENTILDVVAQPFYNIGSWFYSKEDVRITIHCLDDGETWSGDCYEIELTQEQYKRVCEGEKPRNVVPEQFGNYWND